MKRLSEHLYFYEDTCCVYVIKQGADAVLIDFGDGGVLEELPAIGVERVHSILMTHHHRDQAQGLPKAVEFGIPIYVPHIEQDLFTHIDEHWQAREIRNNYNVRQDRFSLLRSVPIRGTLKDYATFEFGEWSLQILPTPGHTTGSISLMGELDGRRIAFTGDLIYGPGKLWSLSATQWTYNGGEGLPNTLASLLDLKERKLDVLLPSHGSPIQHPADAIDLLAERLASLMQHRGQNPRFFQLREQPFEEVTPHLLKSRVSFANYYVLLSESGKALFLDFGYDFLTGIPAGSDRASRRPWLYNVPTLKKQYGVSSIDAVVLTHYHDDHVSGCNVLRDGEGAEIWAAETFADVLERPEAYDLPCLWYDPIPVDQRLPLGEPIRWEEYAFTLHPLPGHTKYAVAIYFEADGKRVLIGGDQYQGDGLQWNYVYQNEFDKDDYIASAKLYRELRPDVILTGHWDPLWPEASYFDELDQRGRVLAELHEQLLPLDEVDLGTESFAAELSPYTATMQAGQTQRFEVKLRNPFAREAGADVTLIVPDGWTVLASGTAKFQLAPREQAVLHFEVRAPVGEEARRARVAVDITVDGRRFGQQAEALVSVIA